MIESTPIDGSQPRLASVPTVPSARSALPTPLTVLVGREPDVAAILAMLDGDATRLLTLTGPGGVGKTRLAIEVARRAEPEFADGAHFVDFAVIRDAALVLPAVAQEVGGSARDDRLPIEQIAGALHFRHALLVLDNLEHLLSDTPTWLPEVLARCARLKVLVTSRIPLNVGGEHRYPVPPLTVPDAGAPADAPDASSFQLFVQRARAIRPGLALDAETCASIIEICQKVDGLPLALELAAARTSALTPTEIASRLTDRFALLTGGHRDAPRRLRSMRDAIAWSYDLLHPDEQRLFRQLSVFVSGFSLDAADVVTDGSALDGVASLVEKSLLRIAAGDGNRTRYLMLESLREFGLEHLDDRGEGAEIRARHAAWYRARAGTGPSGLHSFEHLAHVELLETEHADIRAALTWLDRQGQHAELAELVSRLQFLWYLGAHWIEGMYWYERVLAHPHDTLPPVLVCDLSRGAALIAHAIGSETASGHAHRAMAIARQIGDTRRQAESDFQFALIAEDTGDYGSAEAAFRSARRQYTQMVDRWGQCVCDYHLGVIAYGNHDLNAAVSRLEAVSADAAELGFHPLPMWCRAYLMLIACDQGDCARALALLERQRSASHRGAEHHWETLVATVGVIASTCGREETAARLFGALTTLRQHVPADLPEEATYARARSRVRQSLGMERFEGAWDTGTRMRRPEVAAEIDRLLQGASGHDVPVPPAPESHAGLTTREREVLRLMADGLTNREIADLLFISHRTVARHSVNILGKVGVASRSGAVAWAIRHGLA